MYIGASGFRSLMPSLAGGVVPLAVIRMVTAIPGRVFGMRSEPLLGVQVPAGEVAEMAVRQPVKWEKSEGSETTGRACGQRGR